MGVPATATAAPAGTAGWSHYSLLTVQGEGPASPPLLPLSTRHGPLRPRFLAPAEAEALGSGGDAELVLLRRYMDAERLFNGSLGVRLSGALPWPCRGARLPGAGVCWPWLAHACSARLR